MNYTYKFPDDLLSPPTYQQDYTQDPRTLRYGQDSHRHQRIR